MKGSSIQNNDQSRQPVNHKTRPENKDNLDSRSNEEQDFKGDDTTNNTKETKSGHLKNHGKDDSR